MTDLLPNSQAREDRQRAMKAGFNDHVSKPVQAEDLFDALERVWVQSAPQIRPEPGSDAKIH